MKYNKNGLIKVAAVVGLFAAASVYADNLEKSSKNLSLDKRSVSQLKIDAGAGFLVVKGRSSSDTIEVTADLLTQDDQYELRLDKNSDTAVLIANANTSTFSSWFGDDSPKIDLTVLIPDGIALFIKDGSGNIKVSQIDSDVIINDGSGSLSVTQVSGSLDIEDGSGSIKISDITGPIKVNDGSGSITISNTQSDVDIEDNSGSIRVENVAGKVDIDDGSGSLTVAQVGGHVTIDDGSGSISVSELKSGLTILNDGSGSVSISQVEGDIIRK
jgi:DUF4097 and DUF4098 domain-containing protein YvlB